MSAKGPDRATEGNGRWETPDKLFRWIERLWGPFTLDGAAEAHNAKVTTYYSQEMDAFKQDPRNEVIFVNPPYGNLMPWVDLFLKWSEKNVVVVLIPNSTETKWFMKLVNHENCRDILFLSPRIQFIEPNDRDKKASSNTNGSVVICLRSFGPKDKVVGFVNWQTMVDR